MVWAHEIRLRLFLFFLPLPFPPPLLFFVAVVLLPCRVVQCGLSAYGEVGLLVFFFLSFFFFEEANMDLALYFCVGVCMRVCLPACFCVCVCACVCVLFFRGCFAFFSKPDV